MNNDAGHIEIAHSLMKDIMSSNGMVDRFHPEPKPYPKKWVNKIAPAAGVFFDSNPDLLTNENILEISDGFEEDNEEKYGKKDRNSPHPAMSHAKTEFRRQ